jgi:hypothetical protein
VEDTFSKLDTDILAIGSPCCQILFAKLLKIAWSSSNNVEWLWVERTESSVLIFWMPNSLLKRWKLDLLSFLLFGSLARVKVSFWAANECSEGTESFVIDYFADLSLSFGYLIRNWVLACLRFLELRCSTKGHFRCFTVCLCLICWVSCKYSAICSSLNCNPVGFDFLNSWMIDLNY